MLSGKRHGKWTWARSSAPTTEITIPDDCSKKVWSASKVFEVEKSSPMLCFNKKNQPVNSDGSPLPPRPANVSEYAAYFPQEAVWFFGWTHVQMGHRLGNWTWWTVNGVPVQEVKHNDDGKVIEEKKFYSTGELMRWSIKNPDGKEISSTVYERDGAISSKILNEFKQGTKTNTKRFGAKDVLTFGSKHVQGKEYELCYYRPDGTLKATGHVVGKRPVGTWKFYSDRESLEYEVEVESLGLDIAADMDFNPDWILGNYLLQQANVASHRDFFYEANQVDWSKISGAYSEYVSNFPVCLASLLSKHEALRYVAMGYIEMEAEHQGSLYEATLKVTPFLIRLLNYPEADRIKILTFLKLLGENAKAAISQIQEPWDINDQKSWQFIATGILEILKESSATFAHLAREAGDSEVRKVSTTLLDYADKNDELSSVLINLARSENHAIAVIATKIYINHFVQTPTDVMALLHHPNPLAKYVAASESAFKYGRNSHPDCLPVLVEAFQNPSPELSAAYYESELASHDIRVQTCLALASLRNKEVEDLLPLLCAAIDKLNELDSIAYGSGLLTIALGDGKEPFHRDFVLALEAIAGSTKFYRLINCHEVLDRWQLPHEREKLLKLIEKLKKSKDPEGDFRRQLLT